MENEILMEPDYIHELVELIRSGENKEKIAEQLTNYHDNDISNALDELNEEERKMLYHMLGAERVSEIFAYLDDPGSIWESLHLSRRQTLSRTWMPMMRSMCLRRSMRRSEIN